MQSLKPAKGTQELVVENGGLKLLVPQGIYVPSDDSLLLAAAVSKFARGRFLDLGCGTGIQGITASQNPNVTEVVFADVNPKAILAAKDNVSKNDMGKPGTFIQTDLFSNLEGGRFGTIAFNPPYLPTEKDEDIAWDGGRDGRKLTDKFLLEFEAHLEKRGTLLLLQSSLSGTEKTVKALEKKGFLVSNEGSAYFFFEELQVLKAVR